MDIGSFCSICDVTFTSETHAQSHFTGKKHRKKEDFGKPRQPGGSRRNCVSQKPNGETASERSPPKPQNGFARDDLVGSRSLWRHQDGDINTRTPNESGHLYYCNPCMKNFSGPSPMKQHMASPSHDKQVKKLEAKLAKDNNNNNNRNGQMIPYWKDLSTTGQPRPQEFERSSESSSESSGKMSTPPKGDIVRSGSVASLQSLPRCSGANDLRSMLIGMCMTKLKAELGRIIPSIAESVVDTVLGTLVRDENLTQADETSSQDQDGSRLNLEETTSSPVADNSDENDRKLHKSSTGTWVEKHTQPADADDIRQNGEKPATCSPITFEESEPTNNTETDDVSDTSELSNRETVVRVVSTSEDGDVSNLTEQQRCYQDRNGLGGQRNVTQTTASTNHTETNGDDYVEIYGVQLQMKKGRDFVSTVHQQPIATDPASVDDSMFDLKSATRGEIEPGRTSPRIIQSMTSEGGHSRTVASPDLIDFEEMKNEKNAVMLDHHHARRPITNGLLYRSQTYR
ncbi:uncharacterized protein LOC117299506 [Asterias rubens]|uniref:uncharacterized protein LOC117299506 n=1 Tax=Asterias rubens TaxID=7604 RepID=UPI0014553E10|nr:uncharacterized protein LOC117299506 [Asterias rubens]